MNNVIKLFKDKPLKEFNMVFTFSGEIMILNKCLKHPFFDGSHVPEENCEFCVSILQERIKIEGFRPLIATKQKKTTSTSKKSIVCIKHPFYQGDGYPNLQCSTCCSLFVDLIKKNNEN